MPRRKIALINEEYYHVFNRGVNKQPIFNVKRDYLRAIETIKYYLFLDLRLRYSKFVSLPLDQRKQTLDDLLKSKKCCELICFCLMPNHFHFLLKQNTDGGIIQFLRNFEISYTRYFNTKHERIGPLFGGQFKAVRIEDDKQLLHLSRYIHLNPYSSRIVQSTEKLDSYIWSSFEEYLTKEDGLCTKDVVLSQFKNKDAYRNFVLDRADYQRRLKEIKHLVLD